MWSFFNFLLKVTSCACLIMSGLKVSFSVIPNFELWLGRHLILLQKHLRCKLQKTVRQVSSTKSFVLHDKSFVKSLIYIKNRSNPGLDLWGTPTLTSAHEEDWLFETNLCFLFFRNAFIKLRSLPDAPFCLNLKIRASCQTLSKALEISKKTPRTS